MVFFGQRQSVICELNFSSAILAVKLNRKRLVVVLEEKIHIYDISNMKTLHTIDTVPNAKGTLVTMLQILTKPCCLLSQVSLLSLLPKITSSLPILPRRAMAK